jgi:hypothetical protein
MVEPSASRRLLPVAIAQRFFHPHIEAEEGEEQAPVRHFLRVHLLGSTADRVAEHAPCAVMIVR